MLLYHRRRISFTRKSSHSGTNPTFDSRIQRLLCVSILQRRVDGRSGRDPCSTNRKCTDRSANSIYKSIRSYILEAVKHEKTGRKIPMKKVTDFSFPAELKQKFKENRELETAFNNLTPGRKKGYLLHFSQAKQSSTRLTRIEKNTKRIFDGKGLNDCICGLSKRMPNCDSSHNQLSSK